MKKALYLFLICVFSTSIFAQDSTKCSKHYIELNYTFTHYYNKKTSEWHYTKHLGELARFPLEFIGIGYSYFPKNERYGFQFGVSSKGYFEPKVKTDLEFEKTLTRHRDYVLFSVGGLYSILQNHESKLRFFAFGGVDYRKGKDVILIQDDSKFYLNPDFSWNIQEEEFTLNDVGLFLGANLLYELPYNLFLTTKVKSTYFAYRSYDKDRFSTYDFYINTPSKNTFSVSFGGGYRF